MHSRNRLLDRYRLPQYTLGVEQVNSLIAAYVTLQTKLTK